MRDGEILFPAHDDAPGSNEDDEQAAGPKGAMGARTGIASWADRDPSYAVIGNALGYARELETIV